MTVTTTKSINRTWHTTHTITHTHTTTTHRGSNERRKAFNKSSSKHRRPSTERRNRDKQQQKQKQKCIHCDKRHIGICRLKNAASSGKVDSSNKKRKSQSQPQTQPPGGRGRNRKKQKVKASNPDGEFDSDGNCIHCGKRHLEVCRLKNNRSSGKGDSKKKPIALAPVKVSKNSIHSSWKRELGGIIRYYVHHRTQTQTTSSSGTTTTRRIQVEKEEAETEIESLYYASGCSIPGTREAILHALGITKEMQHEWIQMSMAVEQNQNQNNPHVSAITTCATTITTKQEQKEDSSLHQQPGSGSFTVDRKGIHLDQIQRPGEGPAHAHETWNTVIVPSWAIGKSFFFRMKNRTPLNLSCEMMLDGHRVARNVPLPGNKTRTINPDERRYFEMHKWVLQPAKRVALQNSKGNDIVVKTETPFQSQLQSQQRPQTARYNGIRPSSTDYFNQRVSMEKYPDPTTYGWKFTGSVESSSYVEFFELQLNFGIVRLDFYYTTATVKTTLVHPSTGNNQLFRNTVSPEEYVMIMKNPRSHTGRGYRKRNDRLEEDEVQAVQELEPNQTMTGDELTTTVGDANTSTDTNNDIDDTTIANTTYYAKNENYNFKTQGHSNRRMEMNKLKSTNGFTKWEEAAKQEWAVVHAKFYISLPKTRRFNGGEGGSSSSSSQKQKRNNRDSGRRKRRTNLEKLPEQTPVIDVKSAENATLGTQFQSTGEINNSSSASYTSTKRSNVRMERVKGLTDEDEWKGGPLFEYKLYYRAEETIMANEEEEGSISSGNNDDEMKKEEVEDDLNAYKAEKIIQVTQHHVENMAASSPEEREKMLNNCHTKIKSCDSIKNVDEAVKVYYDMVVKGHFYGNSNTSL